MRVSASLPPVTSLSESGDMHNHKPETSNGPQVSASEVVSAKRSSDVKRTMIAERGCDVQPAFVASNDHLPCPPALQDIAGDTAVPPAGLHSLKCTKQPCVTSLYEDENLHADGDVQGLCSELLSIRIGRHLKDGYSDPVTLESSISNKNLPGSKGSEQDVSEAFSESLASPALRESSIVDDLLDFDGKKLRRFGSTHHPPSLSCLPSSKQHFKQSTFNHQSTIDAYPTVASIECNEVPLPLTSGSPVMSNGFYDNQANSFSDSDRAINYSSVLVGSGKYLEEHNNNVASVDNKVVPDTWENSIITDILSLDFDPWEDSLTSPQGFGKLLADADKQHGSLKIPCLRKAQDSSQSRFSFARQDDFYNELSDLQLSLENATDKSTISHYLIEKKDLCMDKFQDVSSNSSSMESNGFLRRHPYTSSSFSGEYHLI